MNIFEIMYGKDKITIDDEMILLGLANREKTFMNVKSVRKIQDHATSYNTKNTFGEVTHPLQLIYIGI